MLASDRSFDRAVATFATEQIGRTRHLTPEGFLLCEGVRLARTGPMMYAPDEMPGIESTGTMITVLRDADVLFEPDAILSFAGKPVTNGHPTLAVTPETFRDVAVGTVLNPRRGEGVESEYLVGDLLITDRQAIDDIETGKREVSAGYDVDVEQIRPGIGRQTKVMGNHVALVDRGRAGPACAIQDKEAEMAVKRKTVLDRLRKAFKAKDEAGFEENLTNASELMDEDEDEGGSDTEHRIVIEVKPSGADPKEADDEGAAAADPNEDRFAKIEAALASMGEALTKLAGAGSSETTTTDEDTDTEEAKEEKEEVKKDSAMDAVAKAEILAPGIKLPVFDSASVKASAVTALRRSALTTAYADTAKRTHIDAILAGRGADFNKMAPSQIGMVFDAAAALVRQANNAGAGRRFDVPQGPMTAARLQEMIRERRKTRA